MGTFLTMVSPTLCLGMMCTVLVSRAPEKGNGNFFIENNWELCVRDATFFYVTDPLSLMFVLIGGERGIRQIKVKIISLKLNLTSSHLPACSDVMDATSDPTSDGSGVPILARWLGDHFSIILLHNTRFGERKRKKERKLPILQKKGKSRCGNSIPLLQLPSCWGAQSRNHNITEKSFSLIPTTPVVTHAPMQARSFPW